LPFIVERIYLAGRAENGDVIIAFDSSKLISLFEVYNENGEVLQWYIVNPGQ
jgi:hypothetical protein